ncbi:hypothetical protein [Aquimarina litoralis]|uniref:hypothetical protein n=1 Tax=Aquimarina litoralis TaxID=584605 RepID=UPI001C575CAC|nr:hypothetical protein [Aquimarina litoralis]MBW1297467.1 hypothetical protein [Aquimarina litoralis]
MKKIALLLVAAVFAIGIQSCSTEEDVLIEESLLKEKFSIPENAVHFGEKSISKSPDTIEYYVRLFVRYPFGTGIQEQLNHAATVGTQHFDDFYVVMLNGCPYINEWYIKVKKPCYTPINCYPYDNDKSKVAEAEEVGDVVISDSDIIPPGGNNQGYRDCSEIPVHSGESISILDNDDNIDKPRCVICE